MKYPLGTRLLFGKEYQLGSLVTVTDHTEDGKIVFSWGPGSSTIADDGRLKGTEHEEYLDKHATFADIPRSAQKWLQQWIDDRRSHIFDRKVEGWTYPYAEDQRTSISTLQRSVVYAQEMLQTLTPQDMWDWDDYCAEQNSIKQQVLTS